MALTKSGISERLSGLQCLTARALNTPLSGAEGSPSPRSVDTANLAMLQMHCLANTAKDGARLSICFTRPKGLLNSIVSSRSPIADLSPFSTENITETNEYRSGVSAHWPFLSDAGRIVQKDLDIAEYTDRRHNPMIPHTIVLEPGLVVYKIYNGYWFFGRPTLEDLRQDLRTVSEKSRPDWDITTPELKSAWQQGRNELFYPYRKTYVQTLGEQD
jgi:hypothetical protein